MGLSLQHLLRYADEGKYILNRIVTGEESCMHEYQPESKHASVQWKHPSSPSVSTEKFTVSQGYAYRVLGFSVITVSQFSETW
jgi:hypothetical protein